MLRNKYRKKYKIQIGRKKFRSNLSEGELQNAQLRHVIKC